MELPEEIMVLSKFTKFWQISSCLPHYPYRNSVHFHTFGSSQYPVILQCWKILKSTTKLSKTTKSSLKCCLTMMMNLLICGKQGLLCIFLSQHLLFENRFHLTSGNVNINISRNLLLSQKEGTCTFIGSYFKLKITKTLPNCLIQ